MKHKKQTAFPLHPLLLAAASVVSLLSANQTEIQPLVAVRLVVIVPLITFLGYLILKWIFRNRDKAAILATVVVLLFTTYGRVFSLMQKNESLEFLTRHRYLMAFYLFILILSVILTLRMKKPEKMTWPLNLIMAISLAIPLVQVIYFYAANSTSAAQDVEDKTINQDVVLSGEEKPDIYYIIPDSYTREDALFNLYNFDNSGFVESLRDRGFFVADCGRSNYAHTRLSLSSSMNMNYLQDLGVDFDPATSNIRTLDHLIRKSSVNRVLRDYGYQTVAFETGYGFTEIMDADHYYASRSNLLFSPYIEPFEYLYIENSVFKVIIDTEAGFLYQTFSKLAFPFTAQKTRVQNIFKELPTVAELPGPKFVFVHLEIPHHPFIFLPDGSINPDRRYYPGTYMPEDIKLMSKGYSNQVEYVNTEMLKIIDALLEKSAQPPIIIIQGDHGLQGGDRMFILNAIYLPNGGQEDLYPSITPVNTFRVIFNNYFGTNLPYLEDASYMSYSEDKMELSLSEETYEHCLAK